VFGLDNDPDAAATFCANIKGGTFVEKDIRKVKVDVLAPLLRGNGFKTLFSCCAPSALFEAEPDQDRWHPRRSLLLEFGRFVKRWKPDYVFVENAPVLIGLGSPRRSAS
jgi:DNA (cytosine-5)-methyltransferase 1